MTSPFLKWAGGKRWLVANDSLPIPAKYKRYVEPFLGSGAVYFHLKPPSALLSDSNEELIRLYKALRDAPAAMQSKMAVHQRNHCKEYYYKMRAAEPRSEVTRAARTLYLNRTCWNGLYRVNLAGEFNVPIGTKSSVVFEQDDFDAISSMLASAELRCSDFETIIDTCEKGDFLFVDPPYTVQHNLNNFLKYNERIFSWDDQVRLRDAIARAIGRSVCVVVTNADHASVRKLYRSMTRYKKLRRQSVLAGDASKRGGTSEALFYANIGD